MPAYNILLLEPRVSWRPWRASTTTLQQMVTGVIAAEYTTNGAVLLDI
ncbi:MAG TPA: hypothetical protein VFF50_07955 [Candidatus Deferrimicrobiaceae bacterium]|nr:hypothetical protein [Candidatus Deferrimicrobiaceae bacterium]